MKAYSVNELHPSFIIDLIVYYSLWTYYFELFIYKHVEWNKLHKVKITTGSQLDWLQTVLKQSHQIKTGYKYMIWHSDEKLFQGLEPV